MLIVVIYPFQVLQDVCRVGDVPDEKFLPRDLLHVGEVDQSLQGAEQVVLSGPGLRPAEGVRHEEKLRKFLDEF